MRSVIGCSPLRHNKKDAVGNHRPPNLSGHQLSTLRPRNHPRRRLESRRLETCRIPVTLATLPLSIPSTRALRDATSLGGGTAPVPGAGIGREKEGGSFKQA